MEDSSSISKLNSTNYTYLGRANPITSTSGLASSSVVLSRAPPIQKISRSIAGELPQHDKWLSTIKGKNSSTTNHLTTLHITLEDLLPPVQQEPKNSSGEFNVKLQTSNFQITDSNVKFKYKLQISSYIIPKHFKLYQPSKFHNTQIHQSGSSQHYGTSLIRFILLQLLRASSSS